MKKFTKVLLALLLALTMAFVFAACGDDSSDDDGDGDEGGNPPSGPTSFTIKVGGVEQKVSVKPGSNGKVSYTANSYTYTYGSVADSAYENALNRFKVTLPSGKKLGDYSSFNFTWTGVSGDITGYKKLYLIATSDEANVTPYKSKSDLMPYVASQKPYKDGSIAQWYEGDAVQVNGTDPEDVEFELFPDTNTDSDGQADLKALTGDVWFVIFVSADNKDSDDVISKYTISDIEFVE